MYTEEEICGARIGHILSTEAQNLAEVLYEQFRKRNAIANVAKNGGITLEQAQLIKDYIFYEKHIDRRGKFVRFAAAYDMAESWRRLSERSGKNIKPHDILMLKHEALEIAFLLTTPNCTQMQAHEFAEQIYNYKQASDAYYISLGIGVK